jgi:hypothetical protein
LVSLPLGLVGAIAYSLCQWWVLRRDFRTAYWWIVIAVWSHFLFAGYSLISTPLLLGLFDSGAIAIPFEPAGRWFWTLSHHMAAALVFGTAQTLFFLSRVKGAWRWLGFNLLAAFITVTLIISVEAYFHYHTANFSSVAVTWPMKFIGSALVLGGIFGIVTGIPLVNFVNQQKSFADGDHPKAT